jgi:RNA polymerase sigma-70 factor, ECF subfamily
MTHPLPTSSPGDPSRLFDQLVEAQYGNLCSFAHRLVGSRDLAEDIVQDVFAQLWTRWETFDVRDPLPYLYQAIRNRVANDRRQWKVRHRSRDRIAAQANERGQDDAAASLEASDFAVALARAIEALPERRRIIFTMSRQQGLSYAEIARLLGISVKTVETQMTTALRGLRTQLAGYLGAAAAVLAAWR